MPPLATLDEPLFNPSVFGLFETQRRFLGICFSHFAAENKIIPDSSTAKRRPIIGSDVISDPVEEEGRRQRSESGKSASALYKGAPTGLGTANCVKANAGQRARGGREGGEEGRRVSTIVLVRPSVDRSADRPWVSPCFRFIYRNFVGSFFLGRLNDNAQHRIHLPSSLSAIFLRTPYDVSERASSDVSERRLIMRTNNTTRIVTVVLYCAYKARTRCTRSSV